MPVSAKSAELIQRPATGERREQIRDRYPIIGPQSSLGRRHLHEILDNNNNLCIKRSEKFKEVIPRLIKEKKLDCGIRWTERGPMQSDNVAFKFNRYEFGTHRPEYIRRLEKSNKKLCENGIEWKLDLNMSW